MRSASRLGVFLAATLGTALLLPSTTTGSLLNQIDQAIGLEETAKIPRPVLYKRSLVTRVGELTAVKGKRERRQVRSARWLRSLSGDRADVYSREGFPLNRRYELDAGVTTEHWTYPEKRVTYVFRTNRLVETRPF